jgi:hypothetical protein
MFSGKDKKAASETEIFKIPAASCKCFSTRESSKGRLEACFEETPVDQHIAQPDNGSLFFIQF